MTYAAAKPPEPTTEAEAFDRVYATVSDVVLLQLIEECDGPLRALRQRVLDRRRARRAAGLRHLGR